MAEPGDKPSYLLPAPTCESLTGERENEQCEGLSLCCSVAVNMRMGLAPPRGFLGKQVAEGVPTWAPMDLGGVAHQVVTRERMGEGLLAQCPFGQDPHGEAHGLPGKPALGTNALGGHLAGDVGHGCLYFISPRKWIGIKK